MENIERIHVRKRDGKRTTISLDKIYSDLIVDLGLGSLTDWVQSTYDRLSEGMEAGARAGLDKSLSRAIQREAVLACRRRLQRQNKVIEDKGGEAPLVSVAKHIVLAFERVSRGSHAGQSTNDMLEAIRGEIGVSAGHYEARGWAKDDQKLLSRLSLALEGIKRIAPDPEQPKAKEPADEGRQCECQTAQGTRCKMQAVQYTVKDGLEYLACKRHATWKFKPFPGVKGRKRDIEYE